MNIKISRSRFFNTRFFSPFFLCGFIFFTYLTACKKSINEDQILISIEYPSAGTTFNFGDSVNVVARISASADLNTIGVSLVNESGISQAENISISNRGKEFLADVWLHLNNTYATSGIYQIQVSATTLRSSSVEKIPVNVNAVRKQSMGVYVITATDSSSYKCYQLDSSRTNLRFSSGGDFEDIFLNSLSQIISVTDNEKFSGYKLPLYNAVFAVDPPQQITSASFDGTFNFISLDNGAVQAFDNSGFKQFDTGENLFYIPDHVFHLADDVLASVKQANTSIKKLITFFYPGGASRQITDICFDVIEMKKFSDSEVLIFAEENAAFVCYKYSIPSNSFNLIKNFGAISVNKVFQLSANEYYLSASTGIYYYQYNISSSTLVNSLSCSGITSDEVKNLYYCSSANTIHIFNSAFTTDSIVTFNDTVRGISVLYNR